MLTKISPTIVAILGDLGVILTDIVEASRQGNLQMWTTNGAQVFRWIKDGSEMEVQVTQKDLDSDPSNN